VQVALRALISQPGIWHVMPQLKPGQQLEQASQEWDPFLQEALPLALRVQEEEHLGALDEIPSSPTVQGL
jgi:hypothetical protein